MDTPTDRTLRLFESDFVEFFSNTKWFMIPIVWFPIIIYMLFTASAAVDNFNLGMDQLSKKKSRYIQILIFSESKMIRKSKIFCSWNILVDIY